MADGNERQSVRTAPVIKPNASVKAAARRTVGVGDATPPEAYAAKGKGKPATAKSVAKAGKAAPAAKGKGKGKGMPKGMGKSQC